MLVLEHDVRGKGGGKTGYVIAVALLPETSGLSILVITVAYLKSNHLFACKSFNITVLVCCLSFNIMRAGMQRDMDYLDRNMAFLCSC